MTSLVCMSIGIVRIEKTPKYTHIVQLKMVNFHFSFETENEKQIRQLRTAADHLGLLKSVDEHIQREVAGNS